MKENLSSRLDSLMPLVRQASELALSHYGRVSGHDKPDGTVVTEADALTERLIVEGLQKRFPGETIYGEELGCVEGDPRYVWSIDPIDGTAAYASRLPYWGVSIGLFVDRQPALGIISLPALNELYWGFSGGGAYMQSERWGKQRLQIPATASVADIDRNSMICIPSRLHRDYDFDYGGKLRSLGATTVHILLVARHDAIGAVMRSYQWDLAGGVPILMEAGGQVAAVDGGPVDIVSMLTGHARPYVIMSAPQYTDYIRARLHRK